MKVCKLTKNKIIEIIENTKNGIDAFLITSSVNRLWYTRFLSTAGYVLITSGKNYLLIDGRYYEKAISSEDMVNIDEIILVDNYILSLKRILNSTTIKRIGIEADHVTYDAGLSLGQALQNVAILPISCKNLRNIKSDYEIKCVKTAVKITDKTFEYIFSKIKPGLKEYEIANMIYCKMIELGAEELSFPTIVASGKNGSFPHHHTGDRIIKKGDLVTIDMGCKYNGYCSDMTRTIAIHEVSEEYKKVYDIVLESQEATIKSLQLDMYCSAVDSVARNIINNHGYGKYFNHGTGHGLGVEIHEEPYFTATSKSEKIKSMMIFTVEPGIYIPNKFGIRIEDDILMNENEPIILGKTPKKLLIIKN